MSTDTDVERTMGILSLFFSCLHDLVVEQTTQLRVVRRRAAVGFW